MIGKVAIDRPPEKEMDVLVDVIIEVVRYKGK